MFHKHILFGPHNAVDSKICLFGGICHLLDPANYDISHEKEGIMLNFTVENALSSFQATFVPSHPCASQIYLKYC